MYIRGNMSGKEEYIRDEKIRFLKDVLMYFDSFEIGKKYVLDYNKHFRDYEYELHKLNQETAFMYIFNNKIEITKINENMFKVIINLDDYLSIAKMRRIIRFTRTEKDYLLWYHRGTWHFTFGNLIIPIRYDSRLLKLIIIKKPQKYYLTLPDLQKEEIPDKKYGFPIIKGLFYLYEINGKRVEKILKHYKKKYKGMPYILRVKMKNRKFEYAIFKMMLNKDILHQRIKTVLPLIKRISNTEIEEYVCMFTNAVMPNLSRIRGGQFPDFAYATLQDFSYDEVNQILMKFIDIRNDTYLCGVDYSNMLWCMRLPGFMYKYKIKSVYKVLYNLDENTKLFEF